MKTERPKKEKMKVGRRWRTKKNRRKEARLKLR